MITPAQFAEMEARVAPKLPPEKRTPNAVEREGDLRGKIIIWCDDQWPRWKVLWARADRKSTIPVGCQDLTIFASKNRVFLFELKSKNGKPDIDQLSWHKELNILGHKVHVIKSMGEFIDIIGNASKLNSP